MVAVAAGTVLAVAWAMVAVAAGTVLAVTLAAVPVLAGTAPVVSRATVPVAAVTAWLVPAGTVGVESLTAFSAALAAPWTVPFPLGTEAAGEEDCCVAVWVPDAALAVVPEAALAVEVPDAAFATGTLACATLPALFTAAGALPLMLAAAWFVGGATGTDGEPPLWPGFPEDWPWLAADWLVVDWLVGWDWLALDAGVLALAAAELAVDTASLTVWLTGAAGACTLGA
jgi:hypothetical protein